MIDTHCHIDQYSDPEAIASACEVDRIRTIAVTSLPSHYQMANQHLAGYKFVHAALGFHPLLASKNAREISKFESLSKTCSYIGEIGIDGSAQGIVSIESQALLFDRVIAAISGRKRFVTLHSRGAVKQVLGILNNHSMYPVVFHWFSGTKSELADVLDAGHYLSFNPSMARSAKWKSEIRKIPLNRILTETDGPYSRVSGRISRPEDVRIVVDWIASQFGMSQAVAEETIERNLSVLQG